MQEIENSSLAIIGVGICRRIKMLLGMPIFLQSAWFSTSSDSFLIVFSLGGQGDLKDSDPCHAWRRPRLSSAFWFQASWTLAVKGIWQVNQGMISVYLSAFE